MKISEHPRKYMKSMKSMKIDGKSMKSIEFRGRFMKSMTSRQIHINPEVRFGPERNARNAGNTFPGPEPMFGNNTGLRVLRLCGP